MPSNSSKDLANKIRTKFAAVDLSSFTVTKIYDNDLQTPPDDGSEPWARMTILDGISEQADIGAGSSNTRFRTPGVVQVAIHVPLRKGDGTAREIADLIMDDFRSVTVNGITYRTPYLQVIGLQGPYYRVDVNVPFYFDFLD